jgi:branched-chain amino acid transport system substrate-binding protein
VVEYDDTSDTATAVRLTEKLMSQDKVDFVLPPWSTGFNLAVAPVYARYGYPQLAVTANANDETDLVKQMPPLLFFLNQPANFGAALVSILAKLKSDNKINNKIVMLSVADPFGAEAAAGVAPVLKRRFDLAVMKSYPLGASDLTNEIREAKASGADTFIANSYPLDTFLLTQTAIPRATVRRSSTRLSAPPSPNSAALLGIRSRA